MNKWILATAAMLVIFWAGCQKKKKLSPIPSIAFESLTPDSVRAGYFEDTAKLLFNFVDGDADLGSEVTSGTYDIFLTDSRDGKVYQYLFPEFDPAWRSPEFGMEGKALILIQAATLIPRNDSTHLKYGDTLTYEVYVKDRAQHESNHFTTPRLIIKP